MAKSIFRFELPEFREVDSEMYALMQEVLDTKQSRNGVVYQNFDRSMRSFSTSIGWHTDAPILIDRIRLVSSHLPTLFACVVIEYDTSHPLFPRFFQSDPGKAMQMFGRDWVDRAVECQIDETREHGIYVADVTTVQQVPFTYAEGSIGKTLHRSAQSDNVDMFTSRAFNREFIFC